MENYFTKYRKHIIGIDAKIDTPFFGKKKIVYADWTASGRCYELIEDQIKNKIMPYVTNTHTESSGTGKKITKLYSAAKQIIKKHVNADDTYAIISSGSGMTEVINLFQQMLGLKSSQYFNHNTLQEENKPIIFVSHMEHHSNQISWEETIADVEIIPVKNEGFSLDSLKELLVKYKSRKLKIAAITACSNVTGEFTPYQQVSKLMHEHGGYCFVDFAACAPYVHIDINPKTGGEYLDAIYYSSHKFLGGPGSTGILIFSKKIYPNNAPAKVGGGTVSWTNPWNDYNYFKDIELREDGGTPAFLQTIKSAMCHKLKEEIGVENILEREHQLSTILLERLMKIDSLHLLGNDFINRLSIFSFYIEGLHYDLGVRMLNDYFGIQTRGGCSCAGTYGHFLLDIKKQLSAELTDLIDNGDTSQKPGWIRVSLHPTMTDNEVVYIAESIKKLSEQHENWSKNYVQDSKKNSFSYANQGTSIEHSACNFIKDHFEFTYHK